MLDSESDVPIPNQIAAVELSRSHFTSQVQLFGSALHVSQTARKSGCHHPRDRSSAVGCVGFAKRGRCAWWGGKCESYRWIRRYSFRLMISRSTQITINKAWGSVARAMSYTQAHAPHLKSAYVKIVQPFDQFYEQVKGAPLATVIDRKNEGKIMQPKFFLCQLA